MSPDIQEIDLHNNTMGNMSARMMLNALEYRRKSKLIWKKKIENIND